MYVYWLLWSRWCWHLPGGNLPEFDPERLLSKEGFQAGLDPGLDYFAGFARRAWLGLCFELQRTNNRFLFSIFICSLATSIQNGRHVDGWSDVLPWVRSYRPSTRGHTWTPKSRMVPLFVLSVAWAPAHKSKDKRAKNRKIDEPN